MDNRADRSRRWRLCILISTMVIFLSPTVHADYPETPIQVVVPYGAGGGSDTFVRTLQKGIIDDELLPQPLVILNQPGGSATIGSRNVKDSDPDGYKILCLHNAIITAELSDTVDYGPSAFAPIAMTGELSLVVLVREDSPIKDLADLLDEAKRRPKEVKFGANKGAPAYFATLQMEKVRPGADFNIVSADGGADRYAKILGEHLDAGIFSLSEYFDFRQPADTPPEQNIRAIAVMAENRHPSIPDVPCSFEQDIPVLLSNAHYWWAPKETPPEVIEKLASVFEQAMQNENVQRELKRLRVDPVFLTGEPLQKRIDETVERFKASVATEQSVVPRFQNYMIAIVSVLLLWVLFDSMKSESESPEDLLVPVEDSVHARRPWTAISCFLALCVYVIVLGQGWSPYWLATMVMVMIVGGLMTRWQKQQMMTIGILSIVTGVGIQYVFTGVFKTILP